MKVDRIFMDQKTFFTQIWVVKSLPRRRSHRVQFSLFPKRHPRGVWSCCCQPKCRLEEIGLVQRQPEICRAKWKQPLSAIAKCCDLSPFLLPCFVPLVGEAGLSKFQVMHPWHMVSHVMYKSVNHGFDDAVSFVYLLSRFVVQGDIFGGASHCAQLCLFLSLFEIVNLKGVHTLCVSLYAIS